jgi:Alkaline phosphatase
MLKTRIYCFFALVLLGCTPAENIKPDTAVKNVILIIGDGMGPQQVGLLLSYARQAPHAVIRDRQTALDRMMEQGRLGIAMTYSADTLVTDSAASATQLATGLPAGSEMLGLDQDGNRQENLIEKARRLGKATGLVSDTRMTHATPAAFAAHQTHRSQENDIAEDLLAAQPDVMLSGGLSYWIPRQAKRPFPYLIGAPQVKSKRTDNKDLLQTARRQGYTLAFNKAQLQQARGKTLGLFAGSGMPDGIVETRLRSDAGREVPTLREMAVKALDLLDDHERGFFLMIEAGQIDWASHRNDTGLLLHEMLRFNDMLNAVLDWAANRQDTLIIVTADHETGGFGFSYSAENLPPPPSPIVCSRPALISAAPRCWTNFTRNSSATMIFSNASTRCLCCGRRRQNWPNWSTAIPRSRSPKPRPGPFWRPRITRSSMPATTRWAPGGCRKWGTTGRFSSISGRTAKTCWRVLSRPASKWSGRPAPIPARRFTCSRRGRKPASSRSPESFIIRKQGN